MKKLSFVLLLILISNHLQAQSLWTSAEMDFNIVKNLSGNIGGEYRTTDEFSSTDRWALFAGVDYRPLKWLKLSADYKFIDKYVAERTTKKGNIISDYWQPRHRFSISATGKYTLNRLTFSLRERYQYTHHTEQSVAKWDGDDGSAKADELIEAKDKHVLRSCLKVEYNIRKSPFTPFASCELYNSLTDGFSHEKARYTLGTDYKINKHHSLSVFGRYISQSDDDEASGYVIGVGYKFNLH